MPAPGASINAPQCGHSNVVPGALGSVVTRFPHSSPTTSGAVFRGAGTSCLGDKDNSGEDDACDDLFLIPAVSDWGVVALTLLVLTSGTILIHRMRGTVVMPTL